MIYFDLSMGAAGDMLCAALYELLDEDKKQAFLKAFAALGIPDVQLAAEKATRCGIAGTRFCVTAYGEAEDALPLGGGHTHSASCHHHTTLSDIEGVISNLHASEYVKSSVTAVYRLLAAAESGAHNEDVSLVHFHEVGAMDAVADVASFALLMEMLGNPSLAASSVNVGNGFVHCAHGILPVPAPATALLLLGTLPGGGDCAVRSSASGGGGVQGIPFYKSNVDSELCTPTGAALLRYFVKSFDTQMCITSQKIGYGMGSRELDMCNCVRAYLCAAPSAPASSAPAPGAPSASGMLTDEAAVLVCEIDDMTGEELSFAADRLMEKGALDVHTSPVYMKKGRLGVSLTVLCAPSLLDKTVQDIFALTSTLGIRTSLVHRRVLARRTDVVQTPSGTVHIKTAAGYGSTKSKCEADDVGRIAREHDTSFREAARRASEMQ